MLCHRFVRSALAGLLYWEAAFANNVTIGESFEVVDVIEARAAKAGTSIAYLFVDSAEERLATKHELTSIAQKYSSVVDFVILAPQENAWLLDWLRVSKDGKWPALAVRHMLKNSRQSSATRGPDLTADVIQQFMDGVLQGAQSPILLSEEVPVEQGSVIAVVGKSYDSVVLDNEKDVLLEYYNPSCGPCRAVAPTINLLGDLYKTNHDDRVTIAKIDSTANDVPHEVPAWPLIRLFRAGMKTEPILYQGEYEVDALAEFVRREGHHRVDVADEAVVVERQRKAANRETDGKREGGFVELDAPSTAHHGDEL